MNWKIFIARRLYQSNEGGKEVSKPAIRIAIAGIATGLAVMIVAVAVVIGFKHQVKDKITGLSSDILITSLSEAQAYQTSPITGNDSLITALQSVEGVEHVQRYATKPGMIMTDHDFQGIMLKGVAQEYDFTFLKHHLIEGGIPEFTDSLASNKVLISESIAKRLQLKVGDKLNTYYFENKIRARRLVVTGIYQTQFTAFDELFLITDLHTVRRLNNWSNEQTGGLEVEVRPPYVPSQVNDKLIDFFEKGQPAGEDSDYYSRTVEEVYPQIFAWLDLLDINIWVILILMTGVAGFTMISGLLIIILERTSMIGILKALGASNPTIQKIFLSFSVYLIRRGMIWGNIIALSLCGIQYFFKPVKLDAATYYISAVPIELHFGIWLLLNICTLVVSVCVLIAPSYLISRIHPVKSIRFE